MLRDTVLAESLQLPLEDRAELAAELLASLGEEPLEDPQVVEKACAAEIERRACCVLAGESEGRPWPEVKRKHEDRLATR